MAGGLQCRRLGVNSHRIIRLLAAPKELRYSQMMSRNSHFLESLPLKTQFHDAHERRAYGRTLEVARRILEDPQIIDRGRRYLIRFVRADPRQQAAYRLWSDTLQHNAETIVERLVADNERGERLRDSAPVFSPIKAADARGLYNRPE